MGEQFAVEFTHAAKVDALKKQGGMAAVEAWARQEIGDLFDDGLDSLEDLCFHVLGDGEPEFYLFPRSKGLLVIDSVETKEAVESKKGPLAGYKVSVPTGFSS